jgi:hypothetical protein
MSAVAQSLRVRGTIESIDSRTLDVKSRSGAMLKVKLTDNAPMRAVIKASLADIKPGSYVAVTSMPQPDGTQMAVAIAIFPESMRGSGEGSRPTDFAPDSTMTNATVDTRVASVNGEMLVLKYNGGEQKVIVPPSAEIVTYAPGTRADLKPGEKVYIVGAKKLPDGTLEAPNISFGDYGVWR